EPVMNVAPGDRIKFWTPDCFEGRIQNESDKPSEILELPFINPQCGPEMVDGAEKGDVLAIYIESILPIESDSKGICCLIPEFGGLTGTNYTATLNEPLPEVVRRIPLDRQHVYWSDRVTLPYRPHIGTISCSPEIDSINALTPDQHGGNMDMPDICPGNILYLPVKVSGGRFFIGDCHACQGDGEVCGVAVEHATTTSVQIDLIKNWEISWPRIEAENFIMAVGSARPLEDAARIAYRELVYWLEDEYGFDRWDAYMMLSQCGQVRLGNFVDPKYTVGAAIAKERID